MFTNDYDILTPEEAMDYLNIGKNAIYELLGSGAIKGFRIGTRWKIPKKALDDYIEGKINEKTSQKGGNYNEKSQH